MKKSDARKKTEKNEKNTKKTCFFPRKKHEMKKTVFFTTLDVKSPIELWSYFDSHAVDYLPIIRCMILLR